MRGYSLNKLLISVLLVGIYFFLPLSAGLAAEKVYEFKLANFYPPLSSFNSAVWPFWAEQLDKASNGRIKIKVFPAEQLAKSEDLWEAVTAGIADMITLSSNSGHIIC